MRKRSPKRVVTSFALSCAILIGALFIGLAGRVGGVSGSAVTVPMTEAPAATDPATPAVSQPTATATAAAVASTATSVPVTASPSFSGIAVCLSPAATAAPAKAAAVQVGATSRTVRVTRPVAAFLGDSYTTGYAGAGLGRAGWPARVAAAIKLRSLVRAVAGTGFVNPGWTGQPIRTRVESVVKSKPRIVFLAGGHNDRRYGASRASTAADGVIDTLRRRLPDTLLVIIGPIWQDGNPPAAVRGLRDHLRRKAASVGAVFIDPLRAGWFAGRWHRLILSDGIHPSDAGHRRIADLVLRALRADPRYRAISGESIGTVASPRTEDRTIIGGANGRYGCSP